jgi:ATP-dependent RNA helicase SUPV3L1/SUV3
LKENTIMEADVSPTGEVIVAGQNIGRLAGFRFTPDPNAEGQEAKALRAAASKALAGEIEARATRLSTANDDQITLSLDGIIRFIGEPIAVLQAGARALEPRFLLLADEELAGLHREMAETRLGLWLKAQVQKHLGPLFALESGEGATGLARGIAFRLAENLGVLDRNAVSNDVRALDQNARGELRKLGVRFGAHHLFLPVLMKPGPRSLAAQLHVLFTGGDDSGLKDVSHLAYSGRTSIPVDPAIPAELYRIAGYRVAGPRAIRIDILERLADLIRPAITYRPGVSEGEPPAGAADGDAFVVTGAMTSLVGAAGADFAEVLKGLGYRSETRQGPAITVPIKRAVVAPMEPFKPAEPASGGEGMTEAVEADAPGIVQAEPEAAPAEVEAPAEAPEEVAPEPASEAIEAPAAAAPADETAAPVLPIPVEVWRMARGERPQHRGDRRPNRANRTGQQAEGAPGERSGEQRRGPPPWKRGPKPGEQPRPAESAPTGSGEVPRRHDDQRRDRRETFEKFGKREDRPQGDRGKKPFHKGGRPDRENRERGPEHRVFATSGPQPGRKGEKAADPDSPFAKLAALKAQLEGKN